MLMVMVQFGGVIPGSRQQQADIRKMAHFRRGIDSDVFTFDAEGAQRVRQTHSIEPGFNLLWAGRVSKDKNIGFLVDLYRRVLETAPDTNLIIAGDGPQFAEPARAVGRLSPGGDCRTYSPGIVAQFSTRWLTCLCFQVTWTPSAW